MSEPQPNHVDEREPRPNRNGMTTNHPSLLNLVEREAQIPPEQAERALRATLKTLGERLSGGEARDLAEELPGELADELYDGMNAQSFHVDEFVHRVAEREGVDDETARAHAKAVFAALGFIVSPGELRDVASELSKDYAPLLGAALHPPVPPPREPPVPTHTWSAEKIV